MNMLEWGTDAPSLHDSTIVGLRRASAEIEIHVELAEEERWPCIAMTCRLRGHPSHGWVKLDGLLRSGAEPEIMKLVVQDSDLYLGVLVEPEVMGIRWLDIHETVSSVRFRPIRHTP